VCVCVCVPARAEPKLSIRKLSLRKAIRSSSFGICTHVDYKDYFLTVLTMELLEQKPIL